MSFEDIIYEASEGVATITSNRPQVLNAFTGHTVDELTRAFLLAWSDRSVRAVILTGAGDRAFCAGGDQSKREHGGYKGQYVARAPSGVDIEALHSVIRDIPKPVIAAVNGYAIGGGHVRSEEHTSELQSLMRISYAVFCLKNKSRKHR